MYMYMYMCVSMPLLTRIKLLCQCSPYHCNFVLFPRVSFAKRWPMIVGSGLEITYKINSNSTTYPRLDKSFFFLTIVGI